MRMYYDTGINFNGTKVVIFCKNWKFVFETAFF